MTRQGIGVFVLVVLSTLAGSVLAGQASTSQKKAASRPSLAGLWILDKSKSSKGVVADLTVLISQEEPEIRMTRRAASGSEERVDNLVYYTDGRGETNTILSTTDPNGKYEIKSVTMWDRDKLVIKTPASATKIKERQILLAAGRTEKWQISRDGVLHWTTETTLEAADFSAIILPRIEDIKRVFRRKE